MPLPPGRQVSDIILVGPTSSKLISADTFFQELNNVYPTEEGFFRSILGTFPYVLPPNGTTNGGSIYMLSSLVTQSVTNDQYGPMRGIHHCLLNQGMRDVLLLHTGSAIWELYGWRYTQRWEQLIGETTGLNVSVLDRELPDGDIFNNWPTQFVTTPRGVVIIPQGGRAYFYDGEIVAPFGFADRPAAPTGRGPDDSEPWTNETNNGTFGGAEGAGVNDTNYAHNRLIGRPSDYDDLFGYGRIGTTESLPNINISGGEIDAYADSGDAGLLLEGIWRARVAWVDHWGNLSALSPESNDVRCSRQPSAGAAQSSGWGKGTSAGGDAFWLSAKNARFHMLWTGFGGGPEHVRGKNIYRTKDMLNTGDTNYYLMSNDAQVSRSAFATIPDRETRTFPDNVPDAWLSVLPFEIDPVPIFRLGALAFGRFWAANLDGQPGSLRPSLPSLFGTFPANNVITPDPTGGEITGLHTIDQGLLVFTETSTFIIVPNDAGDGFRVSTLSSTVGCMAPSSIATTRWGQTVWLGRDGFYGYDGRSVEFLFADHREIAKTFNRSRMSASNAVFDPNSGQYQCWVPQFDNFDPNRRYKFDGRHWHWDDYDGDTYMKDTCVTADHRSLLLGCGRAEGQMSGVWALDKGHTTMPAKIVTGWLRGVNSQTKASIRRIRFWFRETANSTVTISVRRNWRSDVVHTSEVELYPEILEPNTRNVFNSRVVTDIEKNPDFWDVDESSTAVVRRRRPFWTHRTVDVPTSEVFQLQIDSTDPIEVIGMSYEYETRDEAGSSSRR